MRKFYVILNDKNNLLKNIALCFQSDNLRLAQINNRWILDSTQFESCNDPETVYKKAEGVLSVINAILGIYIHLSEPITINAVQHRNADGKILHRIRSVVHVNVYSSEGIKELSSLHKTETLGSALSNLAQSDPRLGELLDIIGQPPYKWSQIYDVLEYFGDAKTIFKAGFAKKDDIVRLRRTANYYRHLGRLKKEPLPTNPPSLHEATQFILELIKKWIFTINK